jgi:hypothetical protein
MEILLCTADGLKCFTKGLSYRVVEEHEFYERVKVIDDAGDPHNLSGDFLKDNFEQK